MLSSCFFFTFYNNHWPLSSYFVWCYNAYFTPFIGARYFPRLDIFIRCWIIHLRLTSHIHLKSSDIIFSNCYYIAFPFENIMIERYFCNPKALHMTKFAWLVLSLDFIEIKFFTFHSWNLATISNGPQYKLITGVIYLTCIF